MSTETPTTAPPVVAQTSLCALLTWQDPIKTGKVFGAIVSTLVIFKSVNLFNVFFHLAYIGLICMYHFQFI